MKKRFDIADGILLVALGVIFGMIFSVIILKNDYKDGQIDTLNGKIKYELVKQDNEELVWERIEEQ